MSEEKERVKEASSIPKVRSTDKKPYEFSERYEAFRLKEAARINYVRYKREGPKCKKCGYFPESCTCQFQLTELEEFGGKLNYNRMVNADEMLRLKKLDKEGKLIDTLIKEAK